MLGAVSTFARSILRNLWMERWIRCFPTETNNTKELFQLSFCLWSMRRHYIDYKYLQDCCGGPPCGRMEIACASLPHKARNEIHNFRCSIVDLGWILEAQLYNQKKTLCRCRILFFCKFLKESYRYNEKFCHIAKGQGLSKVGKTCVSYRRS